MGRTPCCDKENVKKGPWSPEEDAKLKGYIEENGTGGNWIALPHKIGLKRCGKSCRLRWLNYLRPNIKHGGFTEEEDQIICNLYISIGSRWSIIAAQLPGRTDNDIKNYWNTRLKKKLLRKRTEPSQPRCLQVASEESRELAAPPSHQTLSASALERMQLHLQLQGLYSSSSNNNSSPFSFYNNPSLWPGKFPSLASDQKAIQRQNNASNKLMTMMTTTTSANCTTEEEIDFSGLGFHHSPSSTGAALSMGTSSSNLESANAGSGGGLQADHLHDLVYYRTSPSFLGHEESQLVDLDCYKEIYGEKESSSAENNWWSNSNNINGGFDQESSAASAHLINTDHSMIQEYAYDL